MSIQNPYYFLLSESNFKNVPFLSLAPKADGIETNAPQKIDTEGLLVWTLSALIEAAEGLYEGATFTLSIFVSFNFAHGGVLPSAFSFNEPTLITRAPCFFPLVTHYGPPITLQPRINQNAIKKRYPQHISCER